MTEAPEPRTIRSIFRRAVARIGPGEGDGPVPAAGAALARLGRTDAEWLVEPASAGPGWDDLVRRLRNQADGILEAESPVVLPVPADGDGAERPGGERRAPDRGRWEAIAAPVRRGGLPVGLVTALFEPHARPVVEGRFRHARLQRWWTDRLRRLELGLLTAALRVTVEAKDPSGTVVPRGMLVLDSDRRVVYRTGRTVGLRNGSDRALWGRRVPERMGGDHPPVEIPLSDRCGRSCGTLVVVTDDEDGSEVEERWTERTLDLAVRTVQVLDRLEHDACEASRAEAPEAPAAGPDPDLAALVAEGRRVSERALTALERRSILREIDLNRTVEQAVEHHEPSLRARRVRVLRLLEPELPPARGSEPRLGNVLDVLLGWVRAGFNGQGGTVTIRTWLDDEVYLSISDDGGALEGRHLSGDLTLLDRHGPDRPDTLARLREILRRDGGSLSVESRGPVWTRFVIVLPAAVDAEEDGADDGPVPLPSDVRVTGARSGGKPKVLVVDDNHALRRVLRRYLEREGFGVGEAEDGREALERVREEDFHRIMVDVNMPEMSGPEFFRSLEEVAPEVSARTIFMSGGSAGGEVEAFVREAGRPMLAKPFRLEDVKAALGA